MNQANPVRADKVVVVDDDVVTTRTGGDCYLFAKKIIELLSAR